MTARQINLALFAVAATVQLVVAGGAIVRSEIALRTGTEHLFELRPVDPPDAFRGRYVALHFVVDRAPVPHELAPVRRTRVFVPIETDDRGFAQLGPVALERPASGDFLRLRAGVDYSDDFGDVTSITLPFRRYYMSEDLAKAVDAARWDRGERPAWVTVRVHHGIGVVEELWIEGLPVREWLAQQDLVD